MLVLSVMMLVSLSACSNSDTSSNGEKIYKVGILQLMTHGSLDEAREGMKDYLKEHGYVEGENVEYIYQNPEGDQSNLSSNRT